MCENDVEDEFHVMLKCPLYVGIREALFEDANTCNPAFSTLSDAEKFVFIMFNMSKSCAKACKSTLDRHRRFNVI